jgi:hypothetical protein
MIRRPCPAHYVPLLQAADCPHAAAALQVDCRRYTCSVCRRRRLSAWLIHFACRMHAHAGPLFVATPRAEQWKTIGRGINRRRGDFALVRTAAGTFAVVATVLFPGAASATRPDALDHLAAAMLHLADIRRPISASWSWAMNEDGDRVRRYRRRGAAPKGRFDAAVERLEQHGLHPEVRTTHRGRRADWCFPPAWSELEIDLYFDELEGLSDG